MYKKDNLINFMYCPIVKSLNEANFTEFSNTKYDTGNLKSSIIKLSVKVENQLIL